MRYIILMSLLALVLAACGTPEQPIIGQSSSVPPTMHASQPPTATSASSPAYPPPTEGRPQLATQATTPPTPTPAPVATPITTRPLLREVWPAAPTDVPPTTHLLYSTLEQDTPQSANTFWQLDLRDTTKREALVAFRDQQPQFFPFFGQLSPDGTWIAYLRGSDEKAPLHIMRTDDQKDILVSEGLSSMDLRGQRQIAWSPNGTRLAFKKYWNDGQAFGEELYSYTPEAQPQKLIQARWIHLIGWQDNDHILALIELDRTKPLQIVSMSADTGMQTMLFALPSLDNAFAELLSPGRTRILMSLDSGVYVVSLANGQLSSIQIAPNRSLWVDDATILEISEKGDRKAQLISIDQAHKSLDITVSLPQSDSSNYSMLGSSPDNRYLAICEVLSVNNQRSLIYDIQADAWTIISDQQFCINILGWKP